MSNGQFFWMEDDQVKPRFDGHGDGFANAHRYLLGPGFHMNDFDALIGHVAFAHNTGEKLFAEYVPDDYRNVKSAIRRFAIVALFDRKRSIDYALSEQNRVSFAFYLDICRRIGKTQPINPRFFFVIGGQQPPWTLYERNIETGEPIGEEKIVATSIDKIAWHQLWETLGLKDLREELRRWIYSDAQSEPSYNTEEKK